MIVESFIVQPTTHFLFDLSLDIRFKGVSRRLHPVDLIIFVYNIYNVHKDFLKPIINILFISKTLEYSNILRNTMINSVNVSHSVQYYKENGNVLCIKYVQQTVFMSYIPLGKNAFVNRDNGMKKNYIYIQLQLQLHFMYNLIVIICAIIVIH